jgi:hypothetical protein
MARSARSLLSFSFFNHFSSGSGVKVIEARGMKEEGLYRLSGVASRVQALYHMVFDKEDLAPLVDESDTRTLTSVIKQYFRNMPGSLLRAELMADWIRAVSDHRPQTAERLEALKVVAARLPALNYQILCYMVQHLANVAHYAADNKMKPSNLGVVFGPTFLNPPDDAMATLGVISACNEIVEALISDYTVILASSGTPEPAGVAPDPVQSKLARTASVGSTGGGGSRAHMPLPPTPRTRVLEPDLAWTPGRSEKHVYAEPVNSTAAPEYAAISDVQHAAAHKSPDTQYAKVIKPKPKPKPAANDNSEAGAAMPTAQLRIDPPGRMARAIFDFDDATPGDGILVFRCSDEFANVCCFFFDQAGGAKTNRSMMKEKEKRKRRSGW